MIKRYFQFRHPVLQVYVSNIGKLGIAEVALYRNGPEQPEYWCRAVMQQGEVPEFLALLANDDKGSLCVFDLRPSGGVRRSYWLTPLPLTMQLVSDEGDVKTVAELLALPEDNVTKEQCHEPNKE